MTTAITIVTAGGGLGDETGHGLHSLARVGGEVLATAGGKRDDHRLADRAGHAEHHCGGDTRQGRRDDDRVDRDRDGYDDRDYDRDGRWDDDHQDRRYEEPAQRGGIGGVIDSVLGRGGGLRVGQRVSGDLYGLPYEYRNHYRDGNGVYYRTDGRQIYQIDARSETVIRVYPMSR